MKELAILTIILVSLSLTTIENVSAITENVILDQYNISFDMNNKDISTKTYTEPTHNTTKDGIGLTSYVCILLNSTDILLVGILKYDTDMTSVLAKNATDKFWLNGLTWMINKNVTIMPSVTAWSAIMWPNNKTMLEFVGTYPEKEFDRIKETLSVKENGKEIYNKRLEG